MDKKMNKDELICRMLEINYNNMVGISGLSAEKMSGFYPVDWAANEDYSYKNKVLAEAIQKGVLISDTESYNKNVEGVKISK